MPKVVSAYIEDNKQFENVDEEKREILKTYRNDIMKIFQNYPFTFSQKPCII